MSQIFFILSSYYIIPFLDCLPLPWSVLSLCLSCTVPILICPVSFLSLSRSFMSLFWPVCYPIMICPVPVLSLSWFFLFLPGPFSDLPCPSHGLSCSYPAQSESWSIMSLSRWVLSTLSYLYLVYRCSRTGQLPHRDRLNRSRSRCSRQVGTESTFFCQGNYSFWLAKVILPDFLDLLLCYEVPWLSNFIACLLT